MNGKTEYELSVIIPLYKAEDYIGGCLAKLRDQDIDSLEIIVVNDCSPDQSADRVREESEKYPDLNIRLLEHSENLGASSARNTGLEAATGKYVTFVDSDDWLIPGALPAMLARANSNVADIVVGGIGTFRQYDGEVVRQKYSGLERAGVFRYALSGNLKQIPRTVYSVSAWAKLYRRRLLSEHSILFETHLRYAEDHLFVITAMAAAEMIAIHPEIVYEYRIDNSTSMMSQRATDYFDCIAEVIPKNIAQLEGWPLYYYSQRVLDYELFQNLKKITEFSRKEARRIFSLLRSLIRQIEPKTLRSFLRDNPKFRLDSMDLMSGRFQLCLSRHKAKNALLSWI